MTRDYVPVNDMADCLSVTRRTILGWVRAGHIPPETYIRIGKTIRFDRAAVIAALMAPEKDERQLELPLGD